MELKLQFTGPRARELAKDLVDGGECEGSTFNGPESVTVSFGTVEDNPEAKGWAAGIVANITAVAKTWDVAVTDVSE